MLPRIRVGQPPDIADALFVAPDAVVLGAVTLGPESSVFYQAVLRADIERIVVGAQSNIQDGCILHADEGVPVHVGSRVTVGHRAVLHGATVERGALIGMSATLLNGCVVGEQAIVAAGAVLLEGVEVPARTLAAGSPATVRRDLRQDEIETLDQNAETYLALARAHHALHRQKP